MMRSRTPVRVSELVGEAATCEGDEHAFAGKIKRGLPGGGCKVALESFFRRVGAGLLPFNSQRKNRYVPFLWQSVCDRRRRRFGRPRAIYPSHLPASGGRDFGVCVPGG